MAPALRDIHLPPEPPWWPPAPGWWLLAALATVLLVLIARRAVARWRRLRRRRALLAGFRQLRSRARESSPTDALAEISSFLRRVVLIRERAAASLHGQPWIDHLNRAGGTTFSPEVAEALSEGGFRRRTDVDIDAVLAAVEGWLDGWLRAPVDA